MLEAGASPGAVLLGPGSTPAPSFLPTQSLEARTSLGLHQGPTDGEAAFRECREEVPSPIVLPGPLGRPGLQEEATWSPGHAS